MSTNDISEPDIPKFGRLIQEVRERNRKSQEVVFQHWREILEDSGHTRKWPEAGGRLIGRIERGEVTKQLANIEVRVLCEVVGCSREEQRRAFAYLGRSSIIASSEVERQFRKGLSECEIEVFNEVKALLGNIFTNIDGGSKLSDEDVKKILWQALYTIARRHWQQG